MIWAATWQNQQNECAPNENSDQPGHPPNLIRVFAVRMKKVWVHSYQLSAQGRLIRLGGCPGWSESSLGTQSFCWFCHDAAHFFKQQNIGLATFKIYRQYECQGQDLRDGQIIWAAARQNQQFDLCSLRRLRSAWAFAQSVRMKKH